MTKEQFDNLKVGDTVYFFSFSIPSNYEVVLIDRKRGLVLVDNLPMYNDFSCLYINADEAKQNYKEYLELQMSYAKQTIENYKEEIEDINKKIEEKNNEIKQYKKEILKCS